MWTAYYAPLEAVFHQSGFLTKEAAQAYVDAECAKKLERWDEFAWFILETKHFEKCQDFDDIMAATGFRPSLSTSRLVNFSVEQQSEMIKNYDERVEEVKQRCERLGIEY